MIYPQVLRLKVSSRLRLRIRKRYGFAVLRGTIALKLPPWSGRYTTVKTAPRSPGSALCWRRASEERLKSFCRAWLGTYFQTRIGKRFISPAFVRTAFITFYPGTLLDGYPGCIKPWMIRSTG